MYPYTIPIEENIKLLGLHIDNKLNFNLHISNLCKKAAFHISAVGRIAKGCRTNSSDFHERTKRTLGGGGQGPVYAFKYMIRMKY